MHSLGLAGIILVSWGIAFFEYLFQVPANRMGYSENGGPYNLWQLKVLQEVISLTVFTFFTIIFFQNESFRLNHFIGISDSGGLLYFQEVEQVKKPFFGFSLASIKVYKTGDTTCNLQEQYATCGKLLPVDF